MNRAIAAGLRQRGIFIIHAPSSCMDAYLNHPGAETSTSSSKAANLPEQIGEWCYKIPSEEQGTYPIDQSDGGCDDGPQCPQGSPWKSQVAAIEIKDDDAISDSAARDPEPAGKPEHHQRTTYGRHSHPWGWPPAVWPGEPRSAWART